MRYLTGSILVLVVLMLVSLTVGAANVDLTTIRQDPYAMLILVESRLPRTLAVALTGSALAVAGVVLQNLVRNRFVGPETTGTAESAALGLLAITILVPGAPIWARMIAASLAAMAGTALFVTIIRRLPVREVMLVPIAGLVLAGVLRAIATFIGWQTDLLQYVDGWLMAGEFSGVIAGRYELLWIAALAAGLAWFAADRFAIMGLGDQVATGLGLSVRSVMRLGLGVVAVVMAMVVTTVGLIPFLGLVVPNIVARIMGDNLRASIPVVAVFGAALLLACDLIGRLIRYPYEIPVGTILGVIGAIIFLWMLYARPARG